MQKSTILAKKVCIISFSNIAWDSRVLRQIDAARKEYAVDVIAFGEWIPPRGVHYFRIIKTKRTISQQLKYLLALLMGHICKAAYENAYWMHLEYKSAYEILSRGKYALIHANDWNSLPVSVRVSREVGSRVLFDAHEYSFTEEADKIWWRFLIVPYREYLYRRYQKPVAAKVTVADGIGSLYRRKLGWKMDVILNAPGYVKIEHRPARSNKLRLVHHGAALENRHLEDLIKLVTILDERFELFFYLIPSQPNYYAYLKKTAQTVAPKRIHFKKPLIPRRLIYNLAQFDIGIPLLSVSQSTYYYSLPNKFFDYIMSGLAIVVTPLPMMQKIVEHYDIGEVSPDQSIKAMAKLLNRLTTENVNWYKRNSLELAKSINADVEMKKLMNIYKKITK